MNQPIIREYQKALAIKGQSYPFNSDIITSTKLKFQTDKKIPSTYPTQDIKQLSDYLKSNIQAYYSGKSVLSQQQSNFQHFILEEYLKYTVMASNLFRLTQATNYDTANFSDPYLFTRKSLRTEEAKTNNIFSNVDDILDSTFIGEVKNSVGKATNAIAQSFFKFMSPDIQQFIFPIINSLGNRKRMSDRDFQRAARRVEQSFISYLVQNTSRLNTRISQLMINENTAFASEFSKLKGVISRKPNSKLAKNIIIQELMSEEAPFTTSTKTVKLLNRAYDAFTSNTYTAALRELRDNPNTKTMYGSLLRTAFIQSGVTNSPISFTDIIPTEDFREFLLPAINSLYDVDMLSNFDNTDAFYRNNWKDTTIVPKEIIKYKEDRDSGEYVSKNLFLPQQLRPLLEQKSIDTSPIYIPQGEYENAVGVNKYSLLKYSTKSRHSGTKFLSLDVPKSLSDEERKQRKEAGLPLKDTILYRRVEYPDGSPYLQPYNIKYPENVYAIYAPVNAWGDGYKGQEYYQNVRQSVYDNNTYKPEAELHNLEILQALTGENFIMNEEDNNDITPEDGAEKAC